MNSKKLFLKNMNYYLFKKYNYTPKNYLNDVINNIIYNEKSHIVALFKDYLLFDEQNEFLKRFYSLKVSIKRLNKYFNYYHNYSKIFPNYTILNEKKYLYKNIQKKQRIIDCFENNKLNNNNDDNNNNNNNNIFNTSIINSIFNLSNKEEIELLFNINKDNIKNEEKYFYEKIFDIISLIEKYEKNNNNSNIAINLSNNINKLKNNNNNNNNSNTNSSTNIITNNNIDKAKNLKKYFNKIFTNSKSNQNKIKIFLKKKKKIIAILI